MSLAALALAAAACGDDGPDVTPDAGIERFVAGARLVDHAAVIGGITQAGDVVFYDFDDAGHSVAKVMPLAGGEVTSIASSNGTGKQDVRFEIRGGVVFAWTDRGNRMATLTIWSRATGAVAIGANTRPGRAAASTDGTAVLYERNITATTADVVAGPITGAHALLGTMNSQDQACWQDTDLASVGDRFLIRACPSSGTAFSLVSATTTGTVSELAPQAIDAWYGADRVVWRDEAGALVSARGDGSSRAELATAVAEHVLGEDGTTVAYRTAAGAIATIPVDGTAAATELLPSGAAMLGPLSPDNRSVMYATIVEDRGSDYVQPYTDVAVATLSGTRTLVPGATSCAGCLRSSFTRDGRYALVLDPIDNGRELSGSGPIRIMSVETGDELVTFGLPSTYNAVAYGDGSRFVVFDALRDTTLATGWRYGLTSRGIGDAESLQLALGAEGVVIDSTRTHAVVSFAAGPDDLAGLWVVSL